MGLHAAIEEIDSELEKIDTTEGAEAVEKPAKEAKEEPKEEKADKAAEADVVEDDKPAVKAETTEEKPDSAAFAKMRRDKAAAERRAAALEEQIKTKPAEAKPEARANAEPDKDLDPDAHLRWELAQTKQQLKEVADWKAQQTYKQQQVDLEDGAVKAFKSYEDGFKDTVADYEAVTSFGVQAIAASIRTLNPQLSAADLGKAVQRQILRMAGQAEAQGHDPAEFLYHTAKSWGYKPAEAKAEEKPVAEVKKASVKEIAANKKKSASSMAAGGKSGNSGVDKSALLNGNMSLGEFAKLTPEQLREMEAQ